ncbi:hypothetical protein LCGC14_1854830 [marine sediment metagenome]|uniref:Uncharacterized protein n=1 Tax=marine sediment metagenome TaxID=412755 RepID=A0A0F9G9Q4_9ZZZZ
MNETRVLKVWFDSKGRERVTLEIIREETVIITGMER